jgi:hypothetical protein
MFRSSTIVREFVLSLAKVTFKHLCPYVVVWQHVCNRKAFFFRIYRLSASSLRMVEDRNM